MASTAKPHLSSKHAIIKKANLVIVVVVSLAVFISIFSLFIAKALLNQSAYQQNVIDEKKSALKIAKQNNEDIKSLEQSYLSFATEVTNIIGGSSQGTGPQDGANPKIVLDSLPSEYDFPALSSSIEKLLTDNGYLIDRLGGSEEVQPVDQSTSSADGVIPEIPYDMTVTTNKEGAKKLLDILERSIRPFYVESIELSGTDSNLSTKIALKTFFQPAIKFDIKTEVVK
jgi:hypothetical protein